MVMMFVGGVVLLFDGLLVQFLQWEIYDAGVFCSRLNPYRGKAVKSVTIFRKSKGEAICHSSEIMY